MIARLLFVATLALGGAGAALAQRMVTFDHGDAAVMLPSTYVTTEQNDGTLRANFGPAGDHRLEIAVRDVAGPEGTTDAGIQYVRAEAARKDLRVFEYPERLVYLQPVPDQQEAGKTMRVAVWYVGFGNSVAAVRLVAPAEPTAELKLFLAKGLNDIVASLRRRPPPRAPG
jgi:hypothetical protein